MYRNVIVGRLREKKKMRTFLIIITLFSSFASSHAAELFLFEQEGCEWCEAWHEQVGVSYPITKIGEKLPLIVMDINEPLPPSVKFSSNIIFTPTFVLVENKKELGRILGFLGEYQFWSLLEELLKAE